MSISKRAAVGARHLVIVAYDVSNGRRRDRLAKTLLGFGERTQKSVFECRVSDGERGRMVAAVGALLGPRDRVRYYEVCASCERRVQGVPPPEAAASAVVMV